VSIRGTGERSGAHRVGSAPLPRDSAGSGGPPGGTAAPTDPRRGTPTAGEYVSAQASPDFQALRRALRRFVFPMTAVFLGWYVLYVLATVYARGFLRTKVIGEINVAYVFGLLQFLSTFVIAWLYSRYAEKRLDPIATSVAAQLEGPA